MALITEDGTGRADAESYCSVAEAAAYHAKRGNADAWDAIEDKEAALRKATDYLVQTFRGRWAGIRKTEAQALDWPRYEVPRMDGGEWWNYPDDAIPPELKNATAELALKSASVNLLEDLGPEVQSETIGPISVTYRGGDRQTQFAAVERWLRGLLLAPGQIPMERA